MTFMTNLEAMATTYAATFSPEQEKWNSYPEPVGKAIDAFSLFNIKPMRPLILAIGAKMTPNETAAAYRYLVSLGVRLMIASSTRSGSVEEPLADAAHDVWEGKITSAAELKANLKLAPGDEDFRQAFSVARVSNTEARPVLPAITGTGGPGPGESLVHGANRPRDDQPRTRAAQEARQNMAGP